MAKTDWDQMTNNADVAVIRRGVTSGVAKPAGASGSFVYGFNSLVAAGGVAGLALNLTNFGPIVGPVSQGGGSISGCVKRGPGTAKTGFSPFLFIGANVAGTASEDIAAASAYILGLEDANPSRIVLYKGLLANGAGPALQPGTLTTMLRASRLAYDWDVWHQLRLDMIVNLGGADSDVILRAYRSDLAAHGCDAPVWTEIDFNDALDPIMGAGAYIDDCLGVNSGSAPYAEGYVGFGFKATAINRRGYFDYIAIQRQNAISPP